jgi:hypothetical protein
MREGVTWRGAHPQPASVGCDATCHACRATYAHASRRPCTCSPTAASSLLRNGAVTSVTAAGATSTPPPAHALSCCSCQWRCPRGCQAVKPSSNSMQEHTVAGGGDGGLVGLEFRGGVGGGRRARVGRCGLRAWYHRVLHLCAHRQHSPTPPSLIFAAVSPWHGLAGVHTTCNGGIDVRTPSSTPLLYPLHRSAPHWLLPPGHTSRSSHPPEACA